MKRSTVMSTIGLMLVMAILCVGVQVVDAAFSSTVSERTVQGDKRIVYGTFTNGAGDIGGDIATGLAVVTYIDLQQSGSATVTGSLVVNETLPLATSSLAGNVTIVTDAGVDGYYKAEGR